MATTRPSGANGVITKLAPGWSVTHEHLGTGTLDFGGLSEDTDGEGKRHRVTNVEPVESYLVRIENEDGRGVVAVWLCRLLRPTKSGGKSWTLDMAWRGRHDGEYAPVRLTKKELDHYVTET